MYKSEFIHWAQKYPLELDIISDIYQDAFIVFYEKTLTGKVKEFSSSVKTYLFGIGKNMIFNELRKSKKNLKVEIPTLIDTEKTMDLYLELSDKQQALKAAINKLGKSCQEVLTYFYYQQLSIKEIKVKMNYISENVTKSKKSQCIKKLKSYINPNVI